MNERPAARVLEVVPAKVRPVAAPSGGLPPDSGFVFLRPYPPGLDPAFLGSAWFHDDGAADRPAPLLHLRPRDGRSAPMVVPLTRHALLGGTALLDPTPGWRRLDFLFQIPSALAANAEVYLLAGGQSAPAPGRPPDGVLALADVWRFGRAPPNPFAVADRPPLQSAFVGGAPKSGTTWMQMLLNQHPLIYSTGEGSLLGNARIRDWVPANHWYPPHITSAALNNLGNQALLLRIMNIAREHTGCGVVVDKSPGYATSYRRLLAYMPSARLIHCVRHPLDVLISRLHHEANLIRGGAPSDDMEPHRALVQRLPALLAQPGVLALEAPFWPLIDLIFERYAAFQTEALTLLQQGTAPIILVRYEDMLDRPDDSASRVFAHLGVAAAPELVARCVANVSFANLRDGRRGAEHPFFRAGTAKQFESVIAPQDRARMMASLRAIMPRFDELDYR